MAHKDDPKKMEEMREWLAHASEVLGVDESVIQTLEADLLRLASYTAHNTSRPGTPLTAFLVGLAAGGESTPTEQARVAAEKVEALVADIKANYMEDSE